MADRNAALNNALMLLIACAVAAHGLRQLREEAPDPLPPASARAQAGTTERIAPMPEFEIVVVAAAERDAPPRPPEATEAAAAESSPAETDDEPAPPQATIPADAAPPQTPRSPAEAPAPANAAEAAPEPARPALKPMAPPTESDPIPVQPIRPLAGKPAQAPAQQIKPLAASVPPVPAPGQEVTPLAPTPALKPADAKRLESPSADPAQIERPALRPAAPPPKPSPPPAPPAARREALPARAQAAPPVVADAAALREGRTLLRLLEHGGGPDVEIAWPEDARAHKALYRALRTCYGMATAVLDRGQALHGVGALDRFSGFVRQQASGALPEEAEDAAQIARRAGLAGGYAAVRLFPRDVDAALLGGLSGLVGPAYGGGARIRAAYALDGGRVLVEAVTVNGAAVPGRIALPPARAC